MTFVTNDRAARRLAETHQVLLTGTLGILLALVRHNHLPLDEANSLLALMIQRRYRAPVERLDGLV